MTRKLKLISTISMISLLNITYASTDDMLDGLNSIEKPVTAQSNAAGSNNGGVVQGSTVSSSSTSQASTYQCTRDDQDSIPYKDFLNLVEADKLQINHNPSTGRLRIGAGNMISNCNSMIEPKLFLPDGGSEYLFKIEIKKSGNCSDGLCKYKAYTAEGGIANGEGDTKMLDLPPTLEGFVQCLKKVGAIGGGKGKQALQEFVFESYDAKETGELLFYSHGPLGKQRDAVYSKKNIKGGSCDDFEVISDDGGYLIKSKEQAYIDNKNEQFQMICKSEDYDYINLNIENFSEFSKKQNELKDIRNRLIKSSMKRLREQLDESKSDLSELNADDFMQVTADFHKFIIEPLRKKIADLYYEMKNASSGKERKALEKRLAVLTDELLGYFKSSEGYIGSKEYKLMKDFAAKAPLDQESWREAALNYYESHATAVAYARYKNKKEYVNPRVANKEIDEYFKDEKKIVRMLGELAEDPEKSHANDYNNKIIDLNKAINYNNQDMNAFIQDEQQYMYETCYNPQMYWIQDRQGCANQVMMNIQDEQYYNQQMNGQINSRITDFSSQAQMWANIEKVRNGGTGVQPRATNGMYNFSFKPPASTQRNTSSNMMRQPGPWAQPQQYSSNYGPYQSGYRMPSSNGSTTPQGYWPQSNMGVPNSSGVSYHSYWGAGQQQQLPGAMQPFTYSNTATGPMNFYGGR
jgi:hypothetical protein